MQIKNNKDLIEINNLTKNRNLIDNWGIFIPCYKNLDKVKLLIKTILNNFTNIPKIYIIFDDNSEIYDDNEKYCFITKNSVIKSLSKWFDKLDLKKNKVEYILNNYIFSNKYLIPIFANKVCNLSSVSLDDDIVILNNELEKIILDDISFVCPDCMPHLGRVKNYTWEMLYDIFSFDESETLRLNSKNNSVYKIYLNGGAYGWKKDDVFDILDERYLKCLFNDYIYGIMKHNGRYDKKTYGVAQFIEQDTITLIWNLLMAKNCKIKIANNLLYCQIAFSEKSYNEKTIDKILEKKMSSIFHYAVGKLVKEKTYQYINQKLNEK